MARAGFFLKGCAMKSIVFTAAMLIAAPALAAGAKPAAAPVATAPAAAPAPAIAVAKPSIDMTIEALMADPKAKAVIDANLPGMSSHPMYDSFKGMTLGQLAPMSQGKITDEALAKVSADLAAIK
jgi:hypothetical protein